LLHGSCRAPRTLNEKNISTQQSSPQADPWVFGSDAHQEWAARPEPPAPQGAQTRRGVNRAPGRRRPLPSLRNRRDFEQVFEEATRWHSPLLVLLARKCDPGAARLGITLSRRIGGAVVRNRCKRRIKEVVRLAVRVPAADLVVIGKPALAQASFQELQRALGALLEKASANSGMRRPP